MTYRVIIFTLNGCIHCTSLKSRLNELSIPFTEVEVTQNEEIWNEVLKHTEQDLLPTTFVCPVDSDEGDIYVPTVDYQTEDEIVEIIKTYF